MTHEIRTKFSVGNLHSCLCYSNFFKVKRDSVDDTASYKFRVINTRQTLVKTLYGAPNVLFHVDYYVIGTESQFI